jgi:hypothetical protein
MSHLIPYTATIQQDGIVFAEIDCDLDLSVEFDAAGEPYSYVLGVRIEGKHLDAKMGPVFWLSQAIREVAMADERLAEQAMYLAGMRYVGRGPNDPDGHYVMEES